MNAIARFQNQDQTAAKTKTQMPNYTFKTKTQMPNYTLATSAVLIDLSISGWTAKIIDRKTSDEVAIDKHTKTNKPGAYHKNLLADSIDLKTLTNHAMLIRNTHKRLTYPWSDSGLRLLPLDKLDQYIETINSLKNQYNKLTEQLIQNYRSARSQSAFVLGSLFDPMDYPDEDEVRAKFNCTYNILPLPSVDDFRVDLNKELVSDFEKFLDTSKNNLINGIVEQLHKTTGNLIHSLRIETDDEGKVKKGRVHEATLETILELCGVFDNLIEHENPTLHDLRLQIKNTLDNVDAQDLREDMLLRNITKSELEDVLDKFDF